MAKQDKRGNKDVPTKPSSEEPTKREIPPLRRPSSRPRDPRPFIYVGFDVLFAAVYVYLLVGVTPNRHLWAELVLLGLPTAAALMAVGTLAGPLARSPRAQRSLWLTAVAGGALMMLVTIIVLIFLLMSAAFLSGVYGGFGKAASMGILGAAVVVVFLCGFLPTFQVKYLMTRAGRRAFGLPPVGSAR